MWNRDAASQWLGMERVAVGEGTATLRLTIAAHHCNGHGTCHGGVIFALADSAFAFACNSRNEVTVAQHAQVSFIAPGRLGDCLTAEAKEVSKQGKNGIYDVRVTGPSGVVAEFRGMSRTIRGQVFEEAP
ncbi:phenylacetic acid degradation protein PaaD [Jannaschia pagri]|uniref:Phenylacetic acid degradation protein PaaD n=2 Tax=Roseobacteraceae TaxID=2854170 RepID=A0ABQ4NLU6_9RHOB|nr:phenylacetic acid degradation protein PaaD [Jannaschia sp. AI_61]GIT95373.1 phenylacetic acid degradation protein PaaD [Jannaschia sp. AI_62]